jgi:hypothetical protein
MTDDIHRVSTTATSAPRRAHDAVLADAISAAVLYFLTLLAVVSALGPLLDFFVRSGTDPLFASLAEAAVVAFVMIYSSGWATRLFAVPAHLSVRLIVGAGAMVLLCAFAGADLLFSGVSLAQALRELATPQGGVALLTVTLGAILPLVRARR